MVENNESLISFIGSMIVDMQVKAGVSHEEAKQQCNDSQLKILSNYGGQKLYLQSVQRMYRTKIIEGWRSGRTVRQLSIDFDKTERQIYNIVAAL